MHPTIKYHLAQARLADLRARAKQEAGASAARRPGPGQRMHLHLHNGPITVALALLARRLPKEAQPR